jgi:precorrin-6B methylase 1
MCPLSYAKGQKLYLDSNTIKINDKICILLGGASVFMTVLELIQSLGKGWRIFLCENLSFNNERVTELYSENIAEANIGYKAIILIVKGDIL